MSISSLTQPPDASFQPPDATFSIFQECQSSESEVLVWVSPSHSSSTRDLEKPILALPLHWIGPLLRDYQSYCQELSLGTVELKITLIDCQNCC